MATTNGVKMVKLQLEFIPHTTGYIHIQTNPKLSFSAAATVQNAESEHPDLRLASHSLLNTNKHRDRVHRPEFGPRCGLKKNLYQSTGHMGRVASLSRSRE